MGHHLLPTPVRARSPAGCSKKNRAPSLLWPLTREGSKVPVILAESRIARVIRHVTWVGIVVHAGFVAVFWSLGYGLLAGFNVLSVLMWSAAHVVNQRSRASLAMWLIVLEVTGHTILAVHRLGWGSGFQYYLIPLIPFVMFNERLRATLALLVGFGFLLLYVVLYQMAPADSLGPALNRGLTVTNIVIPLVALGLVTFYFRLASMAVERQIAEMAVTDPLTGLFNRRHMNQRLREEESRAVRHEEAFCVIEADIDYFKRVNDTHGHDAGDRVLVELAALLRETVRAQDIVARWGGEEFLIVLAQTRCAGAVDVAERLRAQAEERLGQLVPGNDTITLTLGVAEYEGSIGDTVKRADEALYRGKEEGRNRVVAAHPVALQVSRA